MCDVIIFGKDASRKIEYKSSQDCSVGSVLDWYHGGLGFKSWQGRGFFQPEFELQCIQLARQNKRMSPSVRRVIIVGVNKATY